MDIKIPDKEEEFFKQIWKINGLQEISKESLIFKICYKMNLSYQPNTFNKKIKSAIENGILVQNKGKLNLSTDLLNEILIEEEEVKEKFSKIYPSQSLKWRIEGNIDKWRYMEVRESPEQEKKSKNFKSLLKEIFSENEIKRGQVISSDKIHYKNIDVEKQVIEALVDGSKGEQYNLIIDIKNAIITHDCQDYLKNRMRKKEFCKHFFRVIYNLRNNDNEIGIEFLNSIKENRKEWKFN
ncbi:MAG: hypothetical protein GY870_14670 [archaeon]|nr:hypothetical protein [archaeon]